MEVNRKYIVLTILVAMVVVAGYLNWSYNGTGTVTEKVSERLGEAKMVSTTVDSSKAENDALKEARESRSTARSKAMEMLNTVINDENTNRENKDKASTEMISMAKNMESEGLIEGILKTKGFEDSVVFITNGIATISVKCSNNLTASDVAKIQDVVKNNADVSGEKITITQVK
ncbi:MAG: SpoIIIAH-like family protein [Bacillota bacterium]|nr:SpoIIIAH-like family protein [Bacillota bacterium]